VIEVAGQTLLVRADAGAAIGTGHVMRCLALAQAWQDAGGAASFLGAELGSALKQRIAAENARVLDLSSEPGSADDAAETAAAAHRAGARWVIVDGYHFDAEYQRAIKAAALRMLFVDDTAQAGHFCADIVLNQNVYADARAYADREPSTRLLMGTDYALLRREFVSWSRAERRIPDVAKRVLVTLGGSDLHNVTHTVLRGLAEVRQELEVHVLVGASNPHGDKLRSAAEGPRHSFRFESNAAHVPERMAWADLAVSAAGSTCWELAFMGLPAAVIVLAANQQPIAEGLAEAGVGANLGRSTGVAPRDIGAAVAELIPARARRARMSAAGRQMVDGLGARRVVEAICAEAT